MNPACVLDPKLLSPRELATVLAALRVFQAVLTYDRAARFQTRESLFKMGHFSDEVPLTPQSIDDLCERLNTQPVTSGDPLATIPTAGLDPIPSIALELLDHFDICDPTKNGRVGARWQTVADVLRVELEKHGLLAAQSETPAQPLGDALDVRSALRAMITASDALTSRLGGDACESDMYKECTALMDATSAAEKYSHD